MEAPMEALTQCWFTRVHHPEHARQRQDDGSATSTCRYCRRRIVTWTKGAWSLADGFNVSRAAELASGRYLTLHDLATDFVVRRFALSHLPDEEAVEAYKNELRERFALDDPDSMMELLDSQAAPRRAAARKASSSQLGTPRSA
jgi:hypothetical protein